MKMESFAKPLMLSLSKHEGLYFSLTLSLSKGEAGVLQSSQMPTDAYISTCVSGYINGLTPFYPVLAWRQRGESRRKLALPVASSKSFRLKPSEAFSA